MEGENTIGVAAGERACLHSGAEKTSLHFLAEWRKGKKHPFSSKKQKGPKKHSRTQGIGKTAICINEGTS